MLNKSRLLSFLVLTSGFLLTAHGAASNFAAYEMLGEEGLLQRLETAPVSEHGRIHAILGRIILDRDAQLANRHLTEASQLLAADDLAGHAYVEAAWCWNYTTVAGIEYAEEVCQSSVDKALKSEDNWALAKAYGAQAMLYYQTGRLTEAFTAGRQSIVYADLTRVATVSAAQYNAMGLILRAQGLFQEGLDHFSQGLQILNRDHSTDQARNHAVDEELYRLLSFNIGLSYADLGQYDLAKDYYAASLEWSQKTNRYAKELAALVYIALADIELGDPQLALESITRALTRPEMLSNEGYIAFAYAVMGEAYMAMEQYQQALQMYEQGISLAADEPNTFEQRRLKTGYARALFMSGNPTLARVQLEQAIAQLRRENSREMLLNSLRLLAELEEAEGQFYASLQAHKEAEAMATAFQQQLVQHELALLRADFELDEKERALAKARQEAILRNGFIMLVLAFGFIAYLFVSRRVQKQRAEERARQAQQLEYLVAERTAELEEQVQQANKAESARVALERQLAEAEKLRVLGQLTGGVAHDFNNLLTVVIGAAELLHENLKDQDSYADLLGHIITAAASGADITRALMAYARKQPLQLETVNLKAFLQERVPLIARTLGGMVEIRLQTSQVGELDVILDSSQLTTALLNLALNARDAQDNQGHVDVSLQVRDERWAIISVRDHGSGMTEEQLVRAIEPFYTTKPEQGNGLGLSMVYGFSKQLGGDLEIESAPGAGTEVRVILPLANAAASQERVIQLTG